MAITVEDGTTVSGAVSYISLADANTYHTLYNNLDWAGTDSDLEQALIQATRAVDLLYAPRFLSSKRDNTNQLQWPRYYTFDNNMQPIEDTTIPQCVKDAVCEVALMYVNGTDIFPTPNTDSTISANKVKIGDIEISKTYSGKQGQTESFTGFNKIDLILYSVLKNKTRIPNIVL